METIEPTAPIKIPTYCRFNASIDAACGSLAPVVFTATCVHEHIETIPACENHADVILKKFELKTPRWCISCSRSKDPHRCTVELVRLVCTNGYNPLYYPTIFDCYNKLVQKGFARNV